MAVFYDSPLLIGTFRYFVRNVVTRENVLCFLRRFLLLGLEDDAINLAPIIAPQFHNLLRPSDSPPPFSLSDLYRDASPKVFAAILCDPQLSSLSADDKVGLIDEFVSQKNSLSEAEREALSRVVLWTEITSFLHLVKHFCDWVPARNTRSLYSQILTNRRSALSRFDVEIQGAGHSISRWYPFAWLQLIADARVRRVSPTVSLVGLVSTLGGLVRSLDPCAFGFVKIFSSVESFAKQFAPKNVFLPNKYFMARADGTLNPMIGIDFGEAAFELETVSVDTQCQVRCDKHPPKPICANVMFKAARDVSGCYRTNGHAAVVVKLENGRAEGQVIQAAGTFSVIAVEFVERNTKGSDLARLASFDAEGHFTNK
jgi:hypothetical protein